MILSKTATDVLNRRYLKRDGVGDVTETPFEMFDRVAKSIAEGDKLYKSTENDYKATHKEFLDVMTNMYFLPNSPTLMNAGTKNGQLSACFVLPVEDSMDGIFTSVKNAALIHKSGGGTGFSFSKLRPNGSYVSSTGGEASGPVSFMKVFNAATDAVKQGGKRRGANMGVLRVDHPDIYEFINCKSKDGELSNFNISVAITDEFMRAVENNSMYNIYYPQGVKYGEGDARKLFNEICEKAWSNGEPGIIFIDEINRKNPNKDIGDIEATNPCGEQPLLMYESCNLGSINLSKMVVYNGSEYEIDEELLRETTKTAIHFLSNVIDVNSYPLKEIEDISKKTRKIGLGVMGFADMLYKLGVRYGSNKSVAIAKKVMYFIKKYAIYASNLLINEFGREECSTLLTIAPTGTLSIIANCSSGIEPVFALTYERNIMDGTKYIEINQAFKDKLYNNGVFAGKINEDSIYDIIDEVIKEEYYRDIFVTAHDVTPLQHVTMQVAFQEFVDNAVSKTINLPSTATIEDVAYIYEMAWRTKLKGITIYRDGSRDNQVLSANNGTSKESKTCTEINEISEREYVYNGYTKKEKVGCGNLYITVNSDENGVCEVFTNLGKSGGCPAQSEATARIASIAMRHGIPEDIISEQLQGIRCMSTLMKKNKNNNINVLSCPDAIGKAIKNVGNNIVSNVKENLNNELKYTTCKSTECPECGNNMHSDSGCLICTSCGYSKCG